MEIAHPDSGPLSVAAQAFAKAISAQDSTAEASGIVMAYLGNPANRIEPDDVAGVIATIYEAVGRGQGRIIVTQAQPDEPAAPPAELIPAVDISASVTADHIVCLEDGAKLKMLKRYLRSRFGMSPEDYRKRWGLSPDYPMVAPGYSNTRSALAKAQGLGTGSRAPAPAPAKRRAAK